jgi:hypothetical protein
VHVFKPSIPVEFTGFDLLLDGAQAGLNLLLLVSAYESRARKRCGMGNRSGDVISIQSPVERNGFAKALRNLATGLLNLPFRMAF